MSGVLVAALLGVLGTLTWQQATLYHDGITFFNHVIAHNPRAREAHLNLGSALLRWNRLEEALAAYRVAEEQRPEGCKPPPYGAGIALYHLGRLDGAEAAYLRALRICPNLAGALAHLSTLRLDQQRHEEALDLARTATDLAVPLVAGDLLIGTDLVARLISRAWRRGSWKSCTLQCRERQPSEPPWLRSSSDLKE